MDDSSCRDFSLNEIAETESQVSFSESERQTVLNLQDDYHTLSNKGLTSISFKNQTSSSMTSNKVIRRKASKKTAHSDSRLTLEQAVSQKLIKSIRNSLATRSPWSSSSLSKKDQTEVTQLLKRKAQEFHELLQTHDQRPVPKVRKVRQRNKKQTTQSQIIREKQTKEETKRLQKAHALMRSDKLFKFEQELRRKQAALKREKIKEGQRQRQESKRQAKAERAIIEGNIRNFYDDKIEELRELLAAERAVQTSLTQEKKALLSESRQAEKSQRRSLLEKSQSALQVKSDQVDLLLAKIASQFSVKLSNIYK